MLRIERSANGQVVFTLSGRMQTEDIEQFQQLLVVETPGQQLMQRTATKRRLHFLLWPTKGFKAVQAVAYRQRIWQVGLVSPDLERDLPE